MSAAWGCLLVLFGCQVVATLSTQNSVQVVVKYPSSQLPSGATLTLRGDRCGLNWDSGVELAPSGTDSWSVTLELQKGDLGQTLACKVLISDDAWQHGSNELLQLPYNMQEETTYTVFPWFYEDKGNYVYERNIYSSFFNNYRDLVIYLPPSYYENPYKTEYQTLVMHDGENLFNASTSAFGVAWMCQVTVNTLVAEGRMEEIIIVGVDNTLQRMDEYTYSYDPQEKAGGKGDEYLDFLETTVLPYVSQRYRISVAQSKLGILGSSLGGLISCYAGWTRGSVYSKTGCMSSSFWWNSQDFNNTILEKYAPPQEHAVFYLDSGSAGPGHDDETETQAVRNHMEQLGFLLNSTLFYYLDVGGEHSEKFWGDRFWVPMTALYPPTPQPGSSQIQ